MSPYKLRRIAWHIEHNRQYLTFHPFSADFRWPVTRGVIPYRLWRSRAWKQDHLILPVLRQRLRWSNEKLAIHGAVPEIFRSIQERLLDAYSEELDRSIVRVREERRSRHNAVHEKFANRRHASRPLRPSRTLVTQRGNR